MSCKPRMPNFVKCAFNGEAISKQFEPYYKDGVYWGTYLKQGHGHYECNKKQTADTVLRYAHSAVVRWEPGGNEEAWDL